MPQVSLASLRVLLTRPHGEGTDDWAAALAAAGAEPIYHPTLTTVPPESWAEVDAALARLADYDFLILTSQTTVDFLLARMPGRRFPADLRATIAAVGPATARAIAKAGGVVGVLPSDQRQEGLVEALRPLAAGKRVLLPMAAGGRALLGETLRALGCAVDIVTVYRTLPRTDLGAPPPFDAAIFASPSALRAYLAAAGASSLAGKLVAAIGPTTAQAAAACGISVVVAASPDIDALILALAQNGRKQGAL
jgi:uroporphyrinogen-III synthase